LRFSDIADLLPEGAAEHLSSRLGAQLLPVQALAIQFGALEGRSLVVCAPTSSGKGSLAELACLAAAARGGKSWHLTPLVGAACEQAQVLQAWNAHGLRVALAAGGGRGADDERLRGLQFDVAVCIYERFARVWSRHPSLPGTSCLVLDEAQTISDPERGWAVELACAAHAFCEKPAQSLILTASRAHARMLSERLGFPLVEVTERPVPLRAGIFFRGRFAYNELPGGAQGEELFRAREPEGLALELMGRGEQILYFCATRAAARAVAAALAAGSGLPAATHAARRLEGIEPTGHREELSGCLAGGVAFHSAELSPEERGVVEEGFKRGEIRAVVSTTTLAHGVNLPAEAAIVEPIVWSPDARTGLSSERLIPRELFEAAGGRAGRLGLSGAGRAILIARTPMEERALAAHLSREEAPPRPGRAPSRLFLCAAGALKRREEVISLARSLPLRGGGRRQARAWVASCAADAQAARLLSMTPGGGMELTPAGAAAAACGLRPETAAALRRSPDPDSPLAEADSLLRLLSTPDADRVPVWATMAEAESGLHRRLAASLGLPAADDSPLKILSRSLRPGPARMRAIKATCALLSWRDGASPAEVEEKTGVAAGDLREAASAAAWLLGSWAALAEACDEHYSSAWLRALAACIEAGLPEELCWVASMQEGRPARRSALALRGTPWADPVAVAKAAGAALSPLWESWEALQAHARRWVDPGEAGLVLSEGPPSLSMNGLVEKIPPEALTAARELICKGRTSLPIPGVRKTLALLAPGRWPLVTVAEGARLDVAVAPRLD